MSAIFLAVDDSEGRGGAVIMPRPAPAPAPAPTPTSASALALRTEIAVIGAGQAGHSAAYHLRRSGCEPHRGCASPR